MSIAGHPRYSSSMEFPLLSFQAAETHIGSGRERDHDIELDPNIGAFAPDHLGIVGRTVTNIDDIDAAAEIVLPSDGNTGPRCGQASNAAIAGECAIAVDDQAGKQDPPAG